MGLGGGLRQRMMFLNQRFKAFGLHMGVNLGGGDVGMAQHFLNAALIGAVIEKMGGEGMTKDMGGDPGRVQAGFGGQPFQHLREAVASEVAAGRA